MNRYNHFSGSARGASCEPKAKPSASSAEGTAGKTEKTRGASETSHYLIEPLSEDSRLSKSTAEQPVPSSPASSHDSPDAPPSAAADDSSEEVLATSGIQQLFQPPTDLPELKQAHKYTYYGRSYDLSFVSNYCFEAVYNSEIRLCYRVGTCFSLPQSAGLWVLGAITGRNANNPAASAVCGVFYEVETGDTATANISWLGVKHIRRMASPEERARCQAAMKALTRIPKPIRTATPRPRTLNLADQRISVYRQKARAGPAMQPSKRPKKKHRSDFVHWKAKYRSEAAASADQVSDDASHDEEDSAMESEQEEEEVEFEFFDARASRSPEDERSFFSETQEANLSEADSTELFSRPSAIRSVNVQRNRLNDFEEVRMYIPSLEAAEQDLLIAKIQEYFALKQLLVPVSQK